MGVIDKSLKEQFLTACDEAKVLLNQWTDDAPLPAAKDRYTQQQLAAYHREGTSLVTKVGRYLQLLYWVTVICFVVAWVIYRPTGVFAWYVVVFGWMPLLYFLPDLMYYVLVGLMYGGSWMRGAWPRENQHFAV